MSEGSITKLIHDADDGLAGAQERLFERVYGELRTMASARMRRERAAPAAGDTTDLVHDAHLRLAKDHFENRRHLFFAYARAMRQILIERARKRRSREGSAGCGGGGGGDSVDHAPTRTPDAAAMLLDAMHVSEMLDRLRDAAPREAEVVLLRFFGGLRDEDTAAILGVDTRTVRRDWSRAKERLAAWSGGGP